MFWHQLVKAGLFWGLRSLKESSGKAISRLVSPQPTFKTYPLRFRENYGHAFARALASAPLRIRTGLSTGGS